MFIFLKKVNYFFTDSVVIIIGKLYDLLLICFFVRGFNIFVFIVFTNYFVFFQLINVNFPERDLLFYIYISLIAFLEWITPLCLSTGIFYSDCYNLIRNFIWIFLLLLLSYIIISIVQLEYEIGVQFYYTCVQSNYF